MLQPSELADDETEPHNDCIGNLEHHVHKVFALVRVPGEDFVYSASIDLFNRLDDYCDEQGMTESRPPFLIKGESGTGKSALLSNWLQRRERTMSKSRSSNTDSFLFWHAVGCSRQSMNINVVIKRLITELKTRFELTRPLPKQQDRYSWELPRFLDLAAKRGKVIIVIDGLNRLVNNDGTEDSLAWLPLEFPPNVRVILSVTIPPSVNLRQIGNAVKAMRTISNLGAFAAEAKKTQAGTKSPGADRAHSPTSRISTIFGKKTPQHHQENTNNGEEKASVEAPPNPFVKAGSFVGEGESKSTSKKSRILAELDRRQIPFMLMTPLNKQLCRSLVEAFIHKSVNSESASLATGPYIAAFLSKQGGQKQNSVMMRTDAGPGRNSMILFGHQPSSASHHSVDANEEVPGFLLFENQVTALLNHSQGGTPLFLRLFLRCLQYAVSRGYSLWMVYEDWMRARSVPELLIRILRTLENNFTRSRTSAQTACDKTMAAGGLPALKQLYSWHPAFQESVTRATTAQSAHLSVLQSGSVDSGDLSSRGNNKMTPITPKQLRRMSTSAHANVNLAALYGEAAGDQIALATIAAQASETSGAAVVQDESTKKLSNEVSQNLGDQAWYATEKDANAKLQRGLKVTEENTVLALATIKQIAMEDETDLLQALVKNIRAAHETAMAAAAYEDPGNHRISHIYSLSQMKLRTCAASTDSPDMYNDDESYNEEEGGESEDDDEDSLVSIEERSITSDHTVHSKTIKITQALIPPSMRVMSSTPHCSTVSFHPDVGGGTAQQQHSSGYNTTTGEAMAVPEVHSPNAKSQYKALNNLLMGVPNPGTPSGGGGGHGAFGAFNAASTVGGGSGSNANGSSVVDPSEGLNTLPVYLRGGVDTTGFGDILGNALALLYASRQGLRESELWKILSLLQYKSERDTTLTQEMKALNHGIVRKCSLLVLNSKGSLLDMFKAEDNTRTGYICHKQILSCIRKIDPEVRREDLIKMLEFADIHTPVAPANVTAANLVHYYQDRDLLIGDKVHYNKLFVVLNKLNKQLKFAEVAPGKTGALLSTASTKNSALGMTSSQSASTLKSIPKPQAATSTGGKNSKKSHQAGDDDYENFNLAGIEASAAAGGAGQLSMDEGGGGSQEASATFLTASMSALSEPDGGGSQAFKPFDGSGSRSQHHQQQSRSLSGAGAKPAPRLSIQLADVEEEEEEEANFSLGPVIEESLLCILSALGVLHDPENKVLILPSDSEPFRQVIYNNYILKRGGGSINYWHGLIIKYFQTEPNSMRKCEELPWHLKICRKWHALRDALVDLEAFDLMSRTDLKNELTEYWVLLTEGPLPFPEDGGRPGGGGGMDGGESGRGPPKPSARKAKEEDDNESTYSHVLREIDHAVNNGLTMKEARKKTYKDHVPPFDIVEELNKSMELWVLNEKPAPQKIHRMIIQIAKFLYEFSHSAHSSPDFLRMGIDLDSLNLFASVLDPAMRGVEFGGKKAAQGEGADDATVDPNSTANNSPMKQPAAAVGAVNVNSPGQVAALKGGKLFSAAEKTAAEKAAAEKAAAEKNAEYQPFGDTTRHEGPKFPPPSMLASNLYVYLRWVWIQFPWIALHSAPDVATLLRQQRKEEEEHRYDAEKKKSTSKLHGSASGTVAAGTGAAGGGAGGLARVGSAPAGTAGELSGHDGLEGDSLGSYANNSESAMLLRVWNVKKSDPTIPVFVKSANRKLAAIKPRTSLTTGLERNVQVTYEKLYEEITSPSHIAKIRLGFKCKDKYRRPFEEEVDFNKNIPFAYHGVRAVKAGSLFPSYEKSLLEDNKRRLQQIEEEAAANNGRTKKKKVKKFDVEQALQQQFHKDPKASSGGGSPFMLVELDDEIRRMNNEEYIKKHKVESIGGAVVRDEMDLEMHACLDRISRMKTICNKLTVIYNEKVRLIHTLHRQVMHRHETDQQLIDEVVNSEVLLRHLNDRNVSMEHDMAEAKKVEDGYLELLKVLKNNPPYIEAHVKALEIEVQLAEKQFQDLCEHRDKLYHETEKSDLYKREQQLERIEYFQHARYEVAIKKKQVLRQMRILKGPGKRDAKANHRRATKAVAGRQASSRNRVESADENTESSGSDSENSGEEKKEIQLTAPVMHFLNAIVRKTTFNETIIKEGDQTLEDIKRRFDEDLLKANIPGKRRLNRMGSMDEVNSPAMAAYTTSAAAAVNSVPTTNAAGANSTTAAQESESPAPAGGGDDGSQTGSTHSRGNGSNHGSLASRDSAGAMPRRSSNMFGGEGLSAHDRRSSGFGSGPGGFTPDVPPYFMHGGGGGSMPSLPPTPGTQAIRRKLGPEQSMQLREAVKAFLPVEPEGNRLAAAGKDHFKSQVHKAYDLLLEKTASSSADELIERFQEGQNLLGSLRKQQTLVDSRIAQLQSEHAELFATFSDLAFISDDPAIPAAVASASAAAEGAAAAAAGVDGSLAAVSSVGPGGGAKMSSPGNGGGSEDANAAATGAEVTKSPVMSDRYLDNQLFAKEVRMNQLLRKKDHAEQIISDVRTAVGYLINLMVINAKLLYALPKSDPPPIKSPDDILSAISWFEDRLTALSEALAMDANKPTGANTADDNKPLSERQLDLALLVQKMNLDIARPGSRQGGKSTKNKQKGGMSSSLINGDGEESAFVSPPGAVMVPPVGRVDKIFDSKMGKLIAEREKAADAQELLQKFSKDDENNSTLVQNFLNEGLNLKETKDLARNANLLVNKRSGRVGSYGLVLENLLNSKGQHFHPTNSSIRAHSTTTAKDAGLASPAGVTASGVHNASSVVTGGSTVATVSREAKDAHAHAHAAAVTATAAHLPHSPGHNHGLSATAPSTMHHSRSSTPVN